MDSTKNANETEGATPKMPATRPKLKITERKGDIFSTSPETTTLLIHACNAQGSWGAGIAKAFSDHYKSAFQVYKAHCSKHTGDDLLGTALLIPSAEGGNEDFIGCIFTSVGKGKTKGSVESILGATQPAMEDLLRQVVEWNSDHLENGRVDEIRMCKINSGLFGVPWEKTKEVLEGLDCVEGVEEIRVVDRD